MDLVVCGVFLLGNMVVILMCTMTVFGSSFCTKVEFVNMSAKTKSQSNTTRLPEIRDKKFPLKGSVTQSPGMRLIYLFLIATFRQNTCVKPRSHL